MKTPTTIAVLWATVIVAGTAAQAESPVFFTDANLKAGIETALGLVDPTPTDLLDQAVGLVQGLPAASFVNADSRKLLTNELEAAIALLHADLYQDALNKLQNAILPRIDGCAKAGQPDSTDWIVTCDAQILVYGPASGALELVKLLVVKPVEPIAQPLLCWAFDETTGATAKDSSRQGNNSTLIGSPRWVPGRIGGALAFDGSSTYAKGPYVPLDNRSFTIMMWINPVLSNSAVVFSQKEQHTQDRSLHVRLGGPSSTDGPLRGIRMGFYSNDLDSPPGLIQDNTWYHVALWYSVENQKRKIYVNGIPVADAAATPYLGAAGNLVVGSWDGEMQFYTGLIDDVRIYSQALTDREIRLHYELGLAGQSYPLPAAPTHMLTVSTTAGGSVTKPGEGAFPYDEGATVLIEAVAKIGYRFTQWSGTAVDAGKVVKPDSPSTSVMVDAGYSLVANFALNAVVEDFEKGKLGTGWSSQLPNPWYVTSEDAHAGKYSVRAGAINDAESTQLVLRATVSAGQIRFWRKVSSEKSCDFYKFWIDTKLQESVSGEQAWKEVSFPVTAGTHTFAWEYKKDDSGASGRDTVYLDDVSIPPAP